MKKRLLCITPGFGRTGAPLALLNLLSILSQHDIYDIYVMAYGDGELLHNYSDLIGGDHIEILNGLNPTLEFRYKLQNNYDVIFLNTSAVCTFSNYFQNTDIPVFWWIHEAPEIIRESFPSFINPHLLSPNFHLLAPSKGAAELFSTYYSYKDICVLPVPVTKSKSIMPELPFSLPANRIIFFIPAAYTYVKGQDILLTAIESLPDEYKQKSFFIFCGYTLEKQKDYKKGIFNLASHIDNILMLEDQPLEIVYSIMNKSHCIVAPSRIDTIPLTIVEGLMFSKLILVSSQAGISSYITDCINGFIFQNQSELTKRLLLIIEDYPSLCNIAAKGHEVYNSFFSPQAVNDYILKIL